MDPSIFGLGWFRFMDRDLSGPNISVPATMDRDPSGTMMQYAPRRFMDRIRLSGAISLS